jgi:hypothetical protein
MAAHIGHSTRSRRFIKVYLMTWAMLAVGAVAYLALLAYPQQAAAPETAKVDPVKVSPVKVNPVKVDPDKAAPATAKDLAEVRGSLTEVRKDVTQLQDAVGERASTERVLQSRVTALEERVATIEPGQTPPATAPTPKATDKSARKLPDGPTADAADRSKEEPPATPPVKASAHPPPPAPIETGSITSKTSKDDIVFGEAIVTPAAQKDFAVQLAAGPSLQVLRQSWGRLIERHGRSLAALKPRVVAPRSEGGIYRLLAGPVSSKADADRICAQLGGGPKACFVTAYAGSPL